MARIDIKGTTGGGGGGSGTVTSVSIATGTTGTNVNATGTVTTSGTLTVNIPVASATNTGKLSNTDWTTFNNKGNGTVTSVAALTLGTTGTDLSSSVANGTTTPVITLNVPTASAANRGALNSSDWTTFNNKQAALVSGTNIKTVNSTTLLGSGNLAVQDVLVSGTNIKTVNSTTLLGSGNLAVQDVLVSGTNIKTVNSTTLLGSGDLAVQDVLVSGTNIKTINGVTILGSGNLSTGNLNGGVLENFIPNLASTAVNLTINSGNTASYNGSVLGVTGTVTITLDASLPNGFSITILQLDAATTTVAGSGGLVIENSQGHSSNNGQYSVISIIKWTNTLAILGGDTA